MGLCSLRSIDNVVGGMHIFFSMTKLPTKDSDPIKTIEKEFAQLQLCMFERHLFD